MTYWKSVLVFLIAAVASANASPLYYWDFNSPSNLLTPTIGNASASVVYASIGVFGGVGQGVGTDQNLVPSYDEGGSLQFSNPASVLIEQRVQFGNLSFADADQVHISFAVRSNEVFEAGDTFKIRYRALTGVEEGPESPSWTEINWTLERPTSTWTIRSFNLTGLAGASTAQIQISTSSFFEIGSVLEFDNVQITAVPEPSAITLSMVAGILIVTLVLRRRQAVQ